MANKIMTQVPVLLSHIDHVSIESVDGDIVLIATYYIYDDHGYHIGNGKALTVLLRSAQQATLRDFITTHVLPAINTAEGT